MPTDFIGRLICYNEFYVWLADFDIIVNSFLAILFIYLLVQMF